MRRSCKGSCRLAVELDYWNDCKTVYKSDGVFFPFLAVFSVRLRSRLVLLEEPVKKAWHEKVVARR